MVIFDYRYLNLQANTCFKFKVMTVNPDIDDGRN